MTERARGGRRGACERGSVSVEVAVIAPAFVFLMLLVVYAGKVAEADGSITMREVYSHGLRRAVPRPANRGRHVVVPARRHRDGRRVM